MTNESCLARVFLRLLRPCPDPSAHRRLVKFIQGEYFKRGYDEVITPNIYNMKLWETSGHAAHYKENMFTFKVEGQEFGMKPMNCPGHCLMFGARQRSFRELPWRLADFGVLHRNEASGALTGLTRVRRFQQDDAHIFCRPEDVQKEVEDMLQFIDFVYSKVSFPASSSPQRIPRKRPSNLILNDLAIIQFPPHFLSPQSLDPMRHDIR